MPEEIMDDKRAHRALWTAFGLIVCLTFYAIFFVGGIRWGLPSARRNALYYTTAESKAAAIRQIRERGTGTDFRTAGNRSQSPLPRSVYNPLRSYHPDEYYVLKMLAGMRPWRLDVDPKWYVIGGAYVYPLGAALKASEVARLVTLESDVSFYIERPEEIAKLYLVGRVLSVALAAGAVVLVAAAARRLWGALAAWAAAVTLLVSPLFVMHAKFMYNDVPGTFWVCLTLFAAAGILRKGTKGPYVLAGIAAGLAAGTKLFHGFALLLPVAAHVLRERGSEEGAAKSPASRVLWMVAIAVAVLVATNPYYLLRPGAAAANFARHVWQGMGFAFYLRAWGFGFGVLPLAAAALGLVVAAGRRRRGACLVGLWGVGYYVCLSIWGKHFARYLLPALPAAAMMVGYIAQWAAGKGNGVSSGRQSVSSVRILAIFCALLCIAAPQIVTDWEVMGSMRGPDSRTWMGERIAREVPAGATIAVTEEPWQFEMPPLDQHRYRIIVCGYDVERLAAARPNAFVYTDLQSDPEVNPHAEIPHEADFWAEVSRRNETGEWVLTGPVLSGGGTHKFWSALGLWRKPPEDMRYVSPGVFMCIALGAR